MDFRDIQNIKVGVEDIQRVMIGTEEVWSAAVPTDVITYNGVTYKSYDNGDTFDKQLSVTDVNINGKINDICTTLGWTTNLNWLDVSGVTDIEGVFGKNKSSSFADGMYDNSNFNGRVDNWDTSSVTSFRNILFENTTFSQELNDWDTSSVTTIVSAFIRSSFNRPLNKWDVSSVTNMQNLMNGNTSFNQDLSGWNTINVNKNTNFDFNATSWSSVNKPSWPTVITYGGVDYQTLDGKVFNKQLVIPWDSADAVDQGDSVKNFRQLINDICTELGWDINLNWLDVSNVTSLYGLFSNYSSVTTDNSSFKGRVDGWDVRNVIDMRVLVYGLDNSDLDLSEWITSSLININLLASFGNFNSDISGWDVSNVTSMNQIFNTNTIFNQDLSGWCVGNVTTYANFDSGTTSWSSGNKPNFANPPC